jgi:hypothetical protein
VLLLLLLLLPPPQPQSLRPLLPVLLQVQIQVLPPP